MSYETCQHMFTDAVAFGGTHFGTGTSQTYLDSVACSGSETNLTDCSYSSFISCSSWRRSAGVRCQGIHIYSV